MNRKILNCVNRLEAKLDRFLLLRRRRFFVPEHPTASDRLLGDENYIRLLKGGQDDAR